MLQQSYNSFTGYAENLYNQTGKTSIELAREIVSKNRRYIAAAVERSGSTPANDPGVLAAQYLCHLAHACNNMAGFSGDVMDKVAAILPAQISGTEVGPAIIAAATPVINATSYGDNGYVIPKTIQGTSYGPAPKPGKPAAVQTAQDIINTLQGLTQGSGNPLENAAGNAGTFVLSETLKKNFHLIIIGLAVLLILVYLTAKAAK